MRCAGAGHEHTRTETALAAAQTATTQADDPALLDELPLAGDIVSAAPDRIKEAIYAAFDIHALYRHDQHQVTIWATMFDAHARNSPARPHFIPRRGRGVDKGIG